MPSLFSISAICGPPPCTTTGWKPMCSSNTTLAPAKFRAKAFVVHGMPAIFDHDDLFVIALVLRQRSERMRPAPADRSWAPCSSLGLMRSHGELLAEWLAADNALALSFLQKPGDRRAGALFARAFLRVPDGTLPMLPITPEGGRGAFEARLDFGLCDGPVRRPANASHFLSTIPDKADHPTSPRARECLGHGWTILSAITGIHQYIDASKITAQIHHNRLGPGGDF